MKLLKIVLIVALILKSSIIFAAQVDHFNVVFNKEKATVGEALDITIKAVDKNENTVKNYTGKVTAFSETDDKVELPEQLSNDEGFAFTDTHEGEVKFENAIIFSEKGQQSISVYDLGSSSEIIGSAEILIESGEIEEKTVNIEILTPENGLTIGTNKIKVSGKTKKNYPVLIKVNNGKEFKTISNSVGIFEKEVDSLENGENFIKAFVLNSEDKKIGETGEVKIKVNSILPNLKKLTITPLNDKLETKSFKTLNAKVDANKGLKEVSLIVNDSVVTLQEKSDGVYTGEFKAPLKAGEYAVDVILKDHIGHTKEEKKAMIFTVIEDKNTTGNKDNSGNSSNSDGNEDSLKITGLKVVTLKTKSVLTWDKLEKAISYKIYKKIGKKYEYVDTVKNPKFEVSISPDKLRYDYFKVRAIGEKALTKSGVKTKYDGDLSEATKVKTGPEIIILLIISMLLGFIAFVYNRRKQY